MTANSDITTQSHTIDLSTGRFHYLRWGAERPPMLLLHGIASSAQSWVRVGPALADRYRVYALDMRGHGDSIKSARGSYSLRQTADDALAFIEALALERPVVMGHSWGGATAIVLAASVGSQQVTPALSSVILEDPAHVIGRNRTEEDIATYTRDIGRPAAELRPEITANNPGWTQADIEGKIDALQKVTREAVLSVFSEGSQAGELLPQLANITAPTLLMRADAALSTTLNDADWQRAQHYLPAHSRAVEIAGAAHNIHRSKFVEFIQAVNDFLHMHVK